MKRRTFLATTAASAASPLLLKPFGPPPVQAQGQAGGTPGLSRGLLASPPVVQNATETGFSVAWGVAAAAGWVEWGYDERLGRRAVPAHHGLASVDERCFSVRVTGVEPGRPVFYRVGSSAIRYETAYKVHRGEAVFGPVRALRLPDPGAERVELAIVNDTHENAATLARLASRIAAIGPDALVWNGDTCNDFYDDGRLGEIVLGPGQDPRDPAAGGWASTRPLLFLPGNHDVRGPRARTLSQALTPWPNETDDPAGLTAAAWGGGRYCFALRHGPVAFIGLDTGEDKPDRREVFAGLAAYEPYREAQRDWLAQALRRPEIAEAPHLVVLCHIPLNGLSGQNDGQTDEGFARYSGQGKALWGPLLDEAGCAMVVSGHTHQFRIDAPDASRGFHQVVGGGPQPGRATLMRLSATTEHLTLIAEDLDGNQIGRVERDQRE